MPSGRWLAGINVPEIECEESYIFIIVTPKIAGIAIVSKNISVVLNEKERFHSTEKKVRKARCRNRLEDMLWPV